MRVNCKLYIYIKTTKLWGGRFEGQTNDLMDAFNSSIHYDKRMWKADIEGSKMYAAALQEINIINQSELELIIEGIFFVLCFSSIFNCI